MELIDEAIGSGARQGPACAVLGLSLRTIQRWRTRPSDGRPGARHEQPANKLSEAERQAVLDAANCQLPSSTSTRCILILR